MSEEGSEAAAATLLVPLWLVALELLARRDPVINSVFGWRDRAVDILI